MDKKNIIGKKVFKLTRNFLVQIDKTKPFIITKIYEYGEMGENWCRHYEISSPDGIKEIVREFDVVLAPDETLEEEQMIQKYLEDNHCFIDGIYRENNEITISIVWGDWSHDHRYCDNLMQYIGYEQSDVIVTEENGSDCYSADRYYIKK